MEEWLTATRLPIGETIATFVDFLNERASGVFDAVSDSLGFVIEGSTDLLLAVPPLALIGAFTLLAWLLQRRPGLTLFTALALLLVVNLGLWEETVGRRWCWCSTRP